MMANKINPEGEGAEAFAHRLARSFQGAYPARLRAVYLLGSRALGEALATSDLDLGLVFSGALGREDRDRVWDHLKTVGPGPVPVDLVILDEGELGRGVRPRMKQGRLLAGEDVLKDCPLLPPEELLGHFAYSALFFIWLIRGKPEELRPPLAYPSPDGPCGGYADRGEWEGGDRFSPGLGTLVNLVVSLANFRLAEIGIYFPSKTQTVREYRRHLPDDPWLDLVEQVYADGRLRWQGRVPQDEAGRRRLEAWCPRVLAFENAVLHACIGRLPEFLRLENSDLRAKFASFARRAGVNPS